MLSITLELTQGPFCSPLSRSVPGHWRTGHLCSFYGRRCARGKSPLCSSPRWAPRAGPGLGGQGSFV